MEEYLSSFLAKHFVFIITFAAAAILLVFVINRLQEWIVRTAIFILMFVMGFAAYSYWNDGFFKDKIHELGLSVHIPEHVRQIPSQLLHKKNNQNDHRENNNGNEKNAATIPENLSNGTQQKSPTQPRPQTSSRLLEF